MNIQRPNPLSGALDYYKLLTPQEIGSILSGIFVDTDTIDFEYDSLANQITATVIDDSITNDKLAPMPPETVKANLELTTENPQDIPIAAMFLGEVEVIGGVAVILNSLITTNSKVYYTIISGGSISSVAFQKTATAGQIELNNGQVGDNGFLDYLLFI